MLIEATDTTRVLCVTCQHPQIAHLDSGECVAMNCECEMFTLTAKVRMTLDTLKATNKAIYDDMSMWALRKDDVCTCGHARTIHGHLSSNSCFGAGCKCHIFRPLNVELVTTGSLVVTKALVAGERGIQKDD